jgi:hypothetical protein
LRSESVDLKPRAGYTGFSPLSLPTWRRTPHHRMRTMFVLYLAVIASGIAYFVVIGLTHH